MFTFQPVGANAIGPSSAAFAIVAGGKAASLTIEILDTRGQGRFERLPV